jgi:hypothetical protein
LAAIFFGVCWELWRGYVRLTLKLVSYYQCDRPYLWGCASSCAVGLRASKACFQGFWGLWALRVVSFVFGENRRRVADLGGPFSQASSPWDFLVIQRIYVVCMACSLTGNRKEDVVQAGLLGLRTYDQRLLCFVCRLRYYLLRVVKRCH